MAVKTFCDHCDKEIVGESAEISYGPHRHSPYGSHYMFPNKGVFCFGCVDEVIVNILKANVSIQVLRGQTKSFYDPIEEPMKPKKGLMGKFW